MAPAARAEEGSGHSWGLKVSFGGRYDDVRMCIATDPGVKGGIAAEIAALAEVGLADGISATFHLPVFRPILFGAVFQMLQLEPDIFLNFRRPLGGSYDLVFGPTIGLSLHYGPSYESGPSDPERLPSFFAVGPKLGASVALDIKRPGRSINFQVGINPYVIPLFAIGDPSAPDGIVAGGMIEVTMRYTPLR